MDTTVPRHLMVLDKEFGTSLSLPMLESLYWIIIINIFIIPLLMVLTKLKMNKIINP